MSPIVSVIMPARNVEPYIDQAINSVRQQTLSSLELIVIDDGSEDGTPACAHSHASQDGRVEVIEGPGRGPGAARNLGLTRARGRWIAVVDADDEIRADRLSTLVSAASNQAQLVADNLTAFYEDGRPEHVWLSGRDWEHEHTVTLEAFLLSGIDGVATDQPGYLKPLFDRLWLQDHGLRYDETLMIGEDYDLVARALSLGAHYRFLPQAGYRYRRHAGSTSHRITAGQLDAMVAGFERLKSGLNARESEAVDRRIGNLLQDQKFIGVVEDLKARSPSALFTAMTDSGLRRRLLRATRDGLSRRLSGR